MATQASEVMVSRNQVEWIDGPIWLVGMGCTSNRSSAVCDSELLGL